MSLFNRSAESRRNSSMDMCEGPLFGKIIRYTIPIILTSFLQLLFHAADLVVVGQFSGSLAVAAVGATGSITSLIVNLFLGLSVGVSVAAAQAIGAGDEEKVRRTVHTAMPTALIGGALLTVVGVVFSRNFLEMMGTPGDVIEESALYMRIYFSAMIFNMLYIYGAAILRAAGDTKGPLRYLTIAGILNVLLNLVFVIVLKMGVSGVALATAISQCISCVLVMRALMHRTDACRLVLNEMRFYRDELGIILRIGLPAGLQSSLFAISNVIIQSSINSFDSIVLSGNSAAGNLESFLYTAMNAFAQTATNFCGQNYGAKKFDRIVKIKWICLFSVSVLGIASGILVNIFGHQLLSIYISDSAQAIEYGAIRLMYICMPYFICGAMDTMTGMIRGLGASLAPMLTSVIGVCGFRIGWIYLVFQQPQFHTLEMLYISYPISWAATLIAHYISYNVIYKHCKMKAEA